MKDNTRKPSRIANNFLASDIDAIYTASKKASFYLAKNCAKEAGLNCKRCVLSVDGQCWLAQCAEVTKAIEKSGELTLYR